MKIVINTSYGGFGLSDKGRERYEELTGLKSTDSFDHNIRRSDPALAKVVGELGELGEIAKDKLLKLSRDGLFSQSRGMLPSQTEELIYKQLGMAYTEPKDR